MKTPDPKDNKVTVKSRDAAVSLPGALFALLLVVACIVAINILDIPDFYTLVWQFLWWVFPRSPILVLPIVLVVFIAGAILWIKLGKK
jgi:hypothetical protein